MTSVVLNQVAFRYPGQAQPAVTDCSLAVAAGQLTWLYGSAGAGCSTLLLLVAGLAPRITGGHRTGQVEVLGSDPADPSGAAHLTGRVAYVTADPSNQLSGIAPTVWEEVAFAPANLGWARERIQRAVGEALSRLELVHLADRHPSRLSGGELQRTMLASALVLDPAVWLLDEPAAALDPPGRDALYRLLAASAESGATVLVASEDADGLALVADRLLLLSAGSIVADGPPSDLLAGEAAWQNGPGGTTVGSVAREAGRRAPSPLLTPPYPLTVPEALERWRS